MSLEVNWKYIEIYRIESNFPIFESFQQKTFSTPIEKKSTEKSSGFWEKKMLTHEGCG